MTENKEQFVFFFQYSSPFSNWHKSPFKAVPMFGNNVPKDLYTQVHELKNKIDELDSQIHKKYNRVKRALGFGMGVKVTDNTEKQFVNNEQWIMYNKALLFKDMEVAHELLQTVDPKKIKQLGRKVKHFNEQIWDQYKEQIVFQGCVYKFTQNPTLKEKLSDTKGKTLVEASPYDRIWGIGLAASDIRAQNRSTWLGLNLLGKILTQVRDQIC